MPALLYPRRGSARPVPLGAAAETARRFSLSRAFPVARAHRSQKQKVSFPPAAGVPHDVVQGRRKSTPALRPMLQTRSSCRLTLSPDGGDRPAALGASLLKQKIWGCWRSVTLASPFGTTDTAGRSVDQALWRPSSPISTSTQTMLQVVTSSDEHCGGRSSDSETLSRRAVSVRDRPACVDCRGYSSRSSGRAVSEELALEIQNLSLLLGPVRCCPQCSAVVVLCTENLNASHLLVDHSP